MTDFSKTFDCIDHSLLIAKLGANGFEKQSISFICSYLTKRKQRTKVNSAVSSAPLLLNIYIYICGNFLETQANTHFPGYADDNTRYTNFSKIENMLGNLQRALEEMIH